MPDYTAKAKSRVRPIPVTWRIFGRDIVVPSYGIREGKRVLNGYLIVGSLRGKRTRT